MRACEERKTGEAPHRSNAMSSRCRFLVCSINEIWLGYCGLNLDFRGGVSICGHSLGSVIAWDLLASHAEEERNGASSFIGNGGSKEMGGEVTTVASDLSWGPGRGRADSGGAYCTLPTSPRCVWLMGSPVGLFLTLRNAHEAIVGTPDFNLMGETTKLFNVFNPSDPVAYRIEPLQLPIGKKPAELPAPAYVPSADYSFGAIGGGERRVYWISTYIANTSLRT